MSVEADPPRLVGMPQLIGGALKLVALVLVVAIPVLGVWVASSLAAYENLSAALVVIGGALLFPVGPIIWELWASDGSRRSSRLLDRLILRTLVLNVLFLSALLGMRPQLGFIAISTRGDWFLDGRSGPSVERVRQIVFRAASRLEWLYLAFHRNPYREVPKKDAQDEKPPAPPPVEHHDVPTMTRPKWPMPSSLHPLIAALPPSVEVSIGEVAYYIASHERDPVMRIKALHDYVADRIAYDAPALALPQIPQEDADAEAVFHNGKGVCSGYAHLLQALGKVTGDEIAYVVGNARLDDEKDQGGSGHAWNAVRIKGEWYLIDATWAAGTVKDGQFTKHYNSNYFLAPPEVFGLDHFPDDERWQLREHPLSRGDFMRQPMMSATFYAEGFDLLSPDRSQVTVDDTFEAQVKNGGHRSLIASIVPKLGGDARHCAVDGTDLFTVRCAPLVPGEYQVLLYSAADPAAMHWSIGRIDVNRR